MKLEGYNDFMSWITSIIVGVVIYIFLYQINKRLEKIEENRGIGYPTSFRVTFKQGIIKSKYFDKLSGQKKSLNDWESWTMNEKEAHESFSKRYFASCPAWLPVHELIRNLHHFITSPDVIGAKLVNFSTT